MGIVPTLQEIVIICSEMLQMMVIPASIQNDKLYSKGHNLNNGRGVLQKTVGGGLKISQNIAVKIGPIFSNPPAVI